MRVPLLLFLTHIRSYILPGMTLTAFAMSSPGSLRAQGWSCPTGGSSGSGSCNAGVTLVSSQLSQIFTLGAGSVLELQGINLVNRPGNTVGRALQGIMGCRSSWVALRSLFAFPWVALCWCCDLLSMISRLPRQMCVPLCSTCGVGRFLIHLAGAALTYFGVVSCWGC